MAVKVVNLKNFGKEFKKFQKLLLEEQKAVVAKSIVDYYPIIVQNSPIDTGLFAQSWDLIEDEKAILLGNYAPHAPIVEYGARPFKPPLQPLLQWAKRVLNDPGQFPYSDRVWALAKYTQAKIEREGIKPHNIMEKAIPEILNNIKMELEKLS